MPEFNRVAILGLGLIGSSLARALSEKKLATHIAAYNQSGDAIQYALKHGFIHSGTGQAAEAVADADLIVFATPSDAFAGMAQKIAGHIKQGAVVTDVASVKRQATHAIRQHLPEHALLVPAHPIAGSEKTGVTAGSAGLFEGKLVILTPEEHELMSEPVKRMQVFWQKVGARIEFMPAEIHDLIYAYVSHLPQIAAFAVAPLIDPSIADEKYRRFTRLTQSDATLWVKICLANADCVGEAVQDFIVFLTQIHGELLENQQDNGEDGTEAALLFAGIVSTCLIATASLLEEKMDANPVRYAGSGFADMTIMSGTDPQTLLAAVSAASTKITPLLEKMLVRLKEIKDAIDAGNGEKLKVLFTVSAR